MCGSSTAARSIRERRPTGVPAFAANLALVIGCLVIAVGYFIPPLAARVNAKHEFHFLGAVFALLVVLMLVLGAISPRREPWKQTYSGDVEMTPWPYARWAGAALVLAVVAIYITFAGGL